MKRKILVVVLSFILTSFIVFSLSSSIEGNAGYALLGDDASDEALSAVEDVLGINRPFPIRYLSFLFSFFTLSWGRTIDGELVFDDAPIERYQDTQRFTADRKPADISKNSVHDIKVVYSKADNGAYC